MFGIKYNLKLINHVQELLNLILCSLNSCRKQIKNYVHWSYVSVVADSVIV